MRKHGQQQADEKTSLLPAAAPLTAASLSDPAPLVSSIGGINSSDSVLVRLQAGSQVEQMVADQLQSAEIAKKAKKAAARRRFGIAVLFALGLVALVLSGLAAGAVLVLPATMALEIIMGMVFVGGASTWLATYLANTSTAQNTALKKFGVASMVICAVLFALVASPLPALVFGSALAITASAALISFAGVGLFLGLSLFLQEVNKPELGKTTKTEADLRGRSYFFRFFAREAKQGKFIAGLSIALLFTLVVLVALEVSIPALTLGLSILANPVVLICLVFLASAFVAKGLALAMRDSTTPSVLEQQTADDAVAFQESLSSMRQGIRQFFPSLMSQLRAALVRAFTSAPAPAPAPSLVRSADKAAVGAQTQAAAHVSAAAKASAVTLPESAAGVGDISASNRRHELPVAAESSLTGGLPSDRVDVSLQTSAPVSSASGRAHPQVRSRRDRGAVAGVSAVLSEPLVPALPLSPRAEGGLAATESLASTGFGEPAPIQEPSLAAWISSRRASSRNGTAVTLAESPTLARAPGVHAPSASVASFLARVDAAGQTAGGDSASVASSSSRSSGEASVASVPADASVAGQRAQSTSALFKTPSRESAAAFRRAATKLPASGLGSGLLRTIIDGSAATGGVNTSSRSR